jgi:hypothetical protein
MSMFLALLPLQSWVNDSPTPSRPVVSVSGVVGKPDYPPKHHPFFMSAEHPSSPLGARGEQSGDGLGLSLSLTAAARRAGRGVKAAQLQQSVTHQKYRKVRQGAKDPRGSLSRVRHMNERMRTWLQPRHMPSLRESNTNVHLPAQLPVNQPAGMDSSTASPSQQAASGQSEQQQESRDRLTETRAELQPSPLSRRYPFHCCWYLEGCKQQRSSGRGRSAGMECLFPCPCLATADEERQPESYLSCSAAG